MTAQQRRDTARAIVSTAAAMAATKVPGFNRVGLDLSNWWVICGGESGIGARPMQPEWVRAIREQCRIGRVPFFFKQWGGVNKKAAGRELDGRTWDEMPRVSR